VSHKIEKLAYIALSSVMVTGIVSYIYMPDTVWAGAGIMAAITSIASLIHVKFLTPLEGNVIESKQTWILLLLTVLAVVAVVFCKALRYPDFYIGMGAGTALVSAITFCVVLLIRFEQSVR